METTDPPCLGGDAEPPLEQMVDIYGVPCDVHPVRRFRDGRQLGVGYSLSEPSTWFAYDCEAGLTGNGIWHKHCGPYATFHDAKDWIMAIREVRK